MKYIHFIRAFTFAVTVALGLGLGGTMHAALAAQVKIYVDFGGSAEPLKGESEVTLSKPNWILVDSAKWTTTKANIPVSWSRITNTQTDSIGSQSSGAGAGKVTPQNIGSQSSGAGAGKIKLAPGDEAKLSANGLDITLNPSTDKALTFNLATKAKPIPLVRVDSFEVTPKGLIPVYSAALTDVLVTSVDWKGQDSDTPTANISLKFASVTIDENTTRKKSKTPLDPTVPTGWNRVSNTTDLTTTPIP